MATPYSGNPGNYPTSAVLPDDGDKPTASLFNVPYEALFDRTAYLKATADENASDIAGHETRLDTAESDIANIETRLVPTVEVFTSTNSWVKPAGAVLVHVLCVGGGGGGAGQDGGAEAGGGGGAGAIVSRFFPASLLPASAPVYIGSAGSGGEAGGSPEGSDGGFTTFGSLFRAAGGKGAPGTTAGEGGDAVALKGGDGSLTDGGTGENGEGPTGNAGTGGTGNGSNARSGAGYGAGGGGAQNATANGGGGGGAGGYGQTPARVYATADGSDGHPGVCIVTTWRSA